MLALGLCGGAAGQATSDVVPQERTLTTAESVKAEVDSSRYHLGPIRLLPYANLSNAGYNNNIFGTTDHKVSDYTATLAAGTRLILPVGTKLFIRGNGAPEYIWYARHADGRTWGHIGDGEVDALFNHASLVAGGNDTKTSSILNAETLRNVIESTQSGRARADVEIAGPLSIFAQGESTRYRFQSIPPAPAGLDDPAELARKEELGRAGLKLAIGPALTISPFAEKVRTTFAAGAVLGDNESTAYGVAVNLDRPRFFVNLSAGYRDAKPIDDSIFVHFSTVTGSYYISYFVRSDVELYVDGSRGTQYSLTTTNPYYLATTNGGGVNFQVGTRVYLRAFGTYGEDRYPILVEDQGASVRRLDRITTWGGGVQYQASRRLAIGVVAEQDRYDSNVAGVSRTYYRINTLVSFELSPGITVRGAFS